MTIEEPSAGTVATPEPPPAEVGDPRLRLTGISKRFGAVRAIRNGDITVRAGRGARPRRGERRRQVHHDQDHLRGGVRGHRHASSSRVRPVDHPLDHATRWPWASPPSTRSRSCSPSSPSRRTSSPAGRSARAAGSTGRAQNAKVVELLELLGLPARYATVPVGDAVDRRAAAGLDRQGAGRRRHGADPRRAVGDPHRRRDRRAVRRRPPADRVRRVRHLHLAPARRAVPHRRRGHRDARRSDHRHLPDRASSPCAGRRADGRRDPVRRARRSATIPDGRAGARCSTARPHGQVPRRQRGGPPR